MGTPSTPFLSAILNIFRVLDFAAIILPSKSVMKTSLV